MGLDEKCTDSLSCRDGLSCQLVNNGNNEEDWSCLPSSQFSPDYDGFQFDGPDIEKYIADDVVGDPYKLVSDGVQNVDGEYVLMDNSNSTASSSTIDDTSSNLMFRRIAEANYFIFNRRRKPTKEMLKRLDIDNNALVCAIQRKEEVKETELLGLGSALPTSKPEMLRSLGRSPSIILHDVAEKDLNDLIKSPLMEIPQEKNIFSYMDGLIKDV